MLAVSVGSGARPEDQSILTSPVPIQHHIVNLPKSEDFNELVTVLLNTNMLVSGWIPQTNCTSRFIQL